MRLIRSCRGSISIFLILVMMPMYTCAYLAIDSAKYVAAKAKLGGAIELMGNAALASFNPTLKELYGIFAMDGASEELSSCMREYCVSMIDNDTQNVVSTKFNDLDATYVTTSSLYNPAVLEKQITGLMKYRAPYNFMYGLSNKITSFLNIDKISKLLKKTSDYADKAAQAGSVAEQIYLLLKDGKVADSKELVNTLIKSIPILPSPEEQKAVLGEAITEADEVITSKNAEELKRAIQNEETNPGQYKDTEIYRYMEEAYAKEAAGGGGKDNKSQKIKLSDLKAIGETNLWDILGKNFDAVVSDLLPKGTNAGSVEQEWGETLDTSTTPLDKIKGFSIDAAATDFVESSYITEYVTEMFSCATTFENDKNILNKSYYNGPLLGCEAEYVIFGNMSAGSNVMIALELIFALRMALNSLYAFTNAAIRKSALAAATAIAGWSGVGVPVTQNLILLAWSAAETIMDMATLCRGKAVPVYKNAKTWSLKLDNISTVLKGGLESYGSAKIDDVFASIKNVTDDTVDDVAAGALEYIDNAAEGVAESLAGSVTDAATKAVSNMLKDIPDYYTKEQISNGIITALNKANLNTTAKSLFVEYCLQGISTKIAELLSSQGESDEEVARSLGKDAGKLVTDSYEELFALVSAELEKYKKSAKNKIDSSLDGSAETIKAEMIEVINGYTDELGKHLGESKTSASPLSAGIGITYKEYLKIFALFNVLRESGRKNMLKRCADVMQINCATKSPGFDINNMYTAVKLKICAGIGLHELKREEQFSY